MDREKPAAGRRRRVAVLAPMRSELQPLFAPFALARSDQRESPLFWGSAGRCEVVATLTGIGMSAGAHCATRVLAATSPDHLIVVGIAGGIGANVSVGDLVVPELVLNVDTGATFRPNPVGDRLPRGTLASSDTLLEGPEEAAKLEARGVVAIDMETAAIAAVCQERGCPWSVFRAVSDRADDGTTDPAVLGLVEKDGSPNLAEVVRFILKRPYRIPQLVRLGRGARAATRVAGRATAGALHSL